MRAVALLMLTGAVLCGCVQEPVRTVVAAPPPPPVPDTNVYFFPMNGESRSPEQQDRDRYECNEWAVRQTGFDPSDVHLPPHQRMEIVAGGPPPAAVVGAGAASGAIVGAAVSNPWHAGRGALFGALAGAAIGGIVESEREHEAAQAQTALDEQAVRARDAALERKASQFRRAISACLEGRGYAVR